MPKYNASFLGRTKDAIGIMSWYDIIVHGSNPDDAWLRLYDTHEHIQRLELSPIVKVSRIDFGRKVQMFDQVGRRSGICQIIGRGGQHDSSIIGKNEMGETVYLAEDAECYEIKSR